jgi:hypothetical protein
VQIPLSIVLPTLVYFVNPEACSEPEQSSEIQWSGWVLSDLPADEGNEPLEGAALEIIDTDGVFLADGIPSESSPGFYTTDVSPDTEIGLRITGETIHPTVWRTRTPRADGYWIYGSLFGVNIETLALTLDQVSDLIAEEIPWADGQTGALIYGAPTFRDERDQEAWTHAKLTALDSTGHTGSVIRIAQDLETGVTGLAAGPSGLVGPDQVEGPVIMFIAHDLAAGPIRLIVEGSDGRTAVADWVAQDGDVLSAFHMTLPEEQ